MKRVADPCKNIPFDSFIQSPIGLVPKAGGDQTRLIFHLSYDFKDGLGSVNSYTPKEKCSVKYHDLDFTVQTYLELCQEMIDEESSQFDSDCSNRSKLKGKWRSYFKMHRRVRKTIFAGKSDLKSAFRILGLSKNSWRWLVMKARDPQTSEWRFFINKCLTFGASISCSHFQHFSDALYHLIKARLNIKRRITNYLDDFLFIACTILLCNFMIRKFLLLCQEIGVPVSMEKTEWASELVFFLGILLYGKNLVLAVPIEKKDNAIRLLTDMVEKKKTTIKQLQQLCDYLVGHLQGGCTRNLEDQ